MYNRNIIEILRNHSKLPLPLGFWPHGELVWSPLGDDRKILGEKTGLIPVTLEALANDKCALKLHRDLQEIGAKFFCIVSPWKTVYNFVKQEGLQTFSHSGKEYTFRCGDPRRWWEVHINWLDWFIDLCKKGSTAQAIIFHVDWELYYLSPYGDYVPAAFKSSIETKMQIIADLLNQYFPENTQIWNDCGGWRDYREEGWIYSPWGKDYPLGLRSVSMFQPHQPYYWENILENMDMAALYCWNICLGKSAKPLCHRKIQAPMTNNWHGVNGAEYDIEYSYALGYMLGGHRQHHKRWEKSEAIKMVTIESPMFKDTFNYPEHVEAFVKGLLDV
jgi:hypothetical protein